MAPIIIHEQGSAPDTEIACKSISFAGLSSSHPSHYTNLRKVETLKRVKVVRGKFGQGEGWTISGKCMVELGRNAPT